MSPETTVGIIIPCYRQARFLAAAIASARAQMRAPDEIFVIDDGSPDDPAKVTRRFAGVTLIRQANRGPSAARNAGLRAATADRLIFLDADDRLLPGAIAAGLAAFARSPDAAFVYGAHRSQRWSGTVDMHRPATARLDLLRCNIVGMIGSAMFDRAKLLEIGGFDEGLRMAEDWDLFLRLTRQYPFASHDTPVAVYRRHLGNATNRLGRVRAGVETVRRREWERGLDPDEQRAWREGEAMLARFYPTIGQRILRLAGRAVGFMTRGARGPRR